MPSLPPSLEQLAERQLAGLWLNAKNGIHTLTQAKRFLKSVGLALRYEARPGLPLASMYQAVRGGRQITTDLEDCGHPEDERQGQRRATELTNELLRAREAVEVNIIAERLVLVHRTLVPSLYALRRRGRPPQDLEGLSMAAVRAYRLIQQKKTITAGGLRAHLGVDKGQLPDPAFTALAELQRLLLVDRGAFEVPEKGLPYLSREGYPYRIFHEVHKDLVESVTGLKTEEAAEAVILAYLKAATFSTPGKLASLFKLCLSREELGQTLTELSRAKKLVRERLGRKEIVYIC